MTEVPRIAIVGGGLAGLATAVALSRLGIAAEVFEQLRARLDAPARRHARAITAARSAAHQGPAAPAR